VQCGDREIDAAIEVVGKSQNETLTHQVGVICPYVIVIELDKSRLFIQIPYPKSGFLTFFTYTDLVFLLKTCFPFMVYLILYTYDMTPLS
jgi:hypothetical protein